MTRNWIRRASAAGALALTLILAAPAQAAGWTLRTPAPSLVEAAWQWLAGLWTPPWEEPGSAIAPYGTKDDRGGGIDPNGGAAPAPACQDGCERSSGIDPNG